MADHAAGMARNEIARKHGRHHSTVSWVIGYRPPKNDSKPTPPVRKRGESPIEFARRCRAWKMENDPEFLAAYRAKMKRAQKRVAWRKKRLKEIAAMEAAKEAERVALGSPDTNNAHVDEPPVQMPPPTFWQRWFGWVRW